MITLISSFKKIQSETIIIEILDDAAILFYRSLSLPANIIDTIEKNLFLKKNAEKTMTFYGDFFGAKKLIAFFPKKETLTDDRSEALRSVPKSTLFIPSCDFREAYEVFTLATYVYEVFLTEKKDADYECYIPESEK